MKLLKLLAAIGLSLLAGGIGSLATTPNIPTWYAGLEKPVFNPPNWVFGPVWTTLYVLMGISLYLIWTKRTLSDKQKAYVLFGIQLFLNALWSLVFFGAHQLLGGLIVILLLDAVVCMTILKFHYISRPAAFLLFPYMAWITYATVLNFALLAMN